MWEFWYENPEGVVRLYPHLKLLPYLALTLKYRVPKDVLEVAVSFKDVLEVAVSLFSTCEE